MIKYFNNKLIILLNTKIWLRFRKIKVYFNFKNQGLFSIFTFFNSVLLNYQNLNKYRKAKEY